MIGAKDAAMQSRCLIVFFGSFLAVSCLSCGVSASAATPFAITAASLTWSLTGANSSQYTVTGIPGDGTIEVNCTYAGTATAKYPICGGGPIALIPVTAGQTLTGAVSFQAWGTPIPVNLQGTPHRSGHLPITGLTLSGVLMAGLGLRRGRRRRIALVVLAVSALAGLAGFSGCGGANPFAMTPGTYPYTITATWESTTPAILGAQASTTISVTVP
jgi:hypothetical protein